MTEQLTHSPKDCAKLLVNTSADMQCLMHRMEDATIAAVTRDLSATELNNTGVEIASELQTQVDDQLIKGDMRPMLKMLNAQAFALNKVFLKMVTIYPDTRSGERHYLELAMKAQNQCRRTLATIADIATPKSATFIKQQNNGENVQVNNNETPEADSVPSGVPEPIREVQKKKA